MPYTYKVFIPITTMIRICKNCNKEFNSDIKIKIYCCKSCQIKDYSKMYYENNKEIQKAKRIKYYYEHQEKERARRRKYYYKNWNKENSEENKKRRNEYKKNYIKNVQNKIKINNYESNRKKNDLNYRIKNNLRRRLLHAFEKYPNGKENTSDEYGIDYKKIVEHLIKVKPSDFKEKKYEIDHIIPLAKFDFNNKDQIKKAFAPENHQWLTRQQNCRKWIHLN